MSFFPFYLKSTSYHNPDKYCRIWGLVSYVNDMVDVVQDENLLNPQILGVYYSDFYAAHVKNGGHFQYFFNSYNESFLINKLVLSGLKNIEATDYIKLFIESLALINSLSPTEHQEFLSFDTLDRSTITNDKYKYIFSELEELDNKFNQLENSNSASSKTLVDLNHAYIATIEDLQIISPLQYHQEIIKY